MNRNEEFLNEITRKKDTNQNYTHAHMKTKHKINCIAKIQSGTKLMWINQTRYSNEDTPNEIDKCVLVFLIFCYVSSVVREINECSYG